jgi:chromosome segregation ATPase
LENTHRAAESARAELASVEDEMQEFTQASADEARELLAANARRSKEEMRREEDALGRRLLAWAEEKVCLMAVVEHLSRANLEALVEAAACQKRVAEQTATMDSLVAGLQHEVERTHELRGKLQEARDKVAPIESLLHETDENKRRVREIEQAMAAQKRIARARKVSAKATARLEELAGRIREAEGLRNAAKAEATKKQDELEVVRACEAEAERRLAEARREFAADQTAVRVAVSELR